MIAAGAQGVNRFEFVVSQLFLRIGKEKAGPSTPLKYAPLRMTGIVVGNAKSER
jgi:hypothetical protein